MPFLKKGNNGVLKSIMCTMGAAFFSGAGEGKTWWFKEIKTSTGFRIKSLFLNVFCEDFAWFQSYPTILKEGNWQLSWLRYKTFFVLYLARARARARAHGLPQGVGLRHLSTREVKDGVRWRARRFSVHNCTEAGGDFDHFMRSFVRSECWFVWILQTVASNRA